jgi:murein DD-endopeptidase MepM/ murein hydrolase activator NlpD
VKVMSRGTIATRVGLALAAVAVTISQLPSVGGAVPPPPNPSDDELKSESANVREAAQRAGALADQVATARADLTQAQIELSQTYEEASQAKDRQEQAEAEAERAQREAVRTQADAQAAHDAITKAQDEGDDFIAASYRQGSTVGSATPFMGADSPKALMRRAELLNSVGGSQLNALEVMRKARVEKGNADAAARAALEEAERREQEAREAKVAADEAYDKAVDAEEVAQERTDELLERHRELEAEHKEAKATLAKLQGKRDQYNEWKAERERERRAAAERKRQQQAQASAGQSSGGQSSNTQVSSSTPSSSGVVAPTHGRITSTYGPRWGYIHYGIDIANSIGTPIVSVMPGTVINSGPASGFGLWVKIRHDNGVHTVYGHNDRNLVSVGQRVRAGQQIANIGNRGQSTGPHLHFEVHVNGSKIDPLPWLRGNGVNI